MKTKILCMVSVMGLLFSCDVKQKELAQRELDSLRTELQTNHQMAEAMTEIGTYIDSIDANRGTLRMQMTEGTNYESYVARMRDINQWVRKTERKMEALQKTAKKSNDKTYIAAINKLKADLDVRNKEIIALTEQVNYYKTQNEGLISTVSLQKAEIEDKLNQIRTKQEETAKLEEQVEHLITQSKVDQGEAYYSTAMAVEETANRTKFAPKKKKNTRKQALELYKLALINGKSEAQARITELEKKL